MTDIDDIDKNGSTMLMIAAAKGRTEDVKQYLVAGADPTIKDRSGMVARNRAQNKGHKDVIILLEKAESEWIPNEKIVSHDTIKENDHGKSSNETTVNNDNSDFNYDHISNVVVTDINMPFWSMVLFMVKWTIASIPAIFILFLIGAFIVSIFGGVFVGLANIFN